MIVVIIRKVAAQVYSKIQTGNPIDSLQTDVYPTNVHVSLGGGTETIGD